LTLFLPKLLMGKPNPDFITQAWVEQARHAIHVLNKARMTQGDLSEEVAEQAEVLIFSFSQLLNLTADFLDQKGSLPNN